MHVTVCNPYTYKPPYRTTFLYHQTSSTQFLKPSTEISPTNLAKAKMTSFYGNPPAETGLFVSDEETHPHLQNELPYVDPATAPPAIQAAFRLNPFNRHFIEVLANADGQFPALMQLLASLYTDQTRELSTLEWAEINMRTASLLGSAVLFLENSQLALVHNMPPEKVTRFSSDSSTTRTTGRLESGC